MRCGNCNCNDVPLKRCAACHATSYCGVACQRADWDVHKIFCVGPDVAVTTAPVGIVVGTNVDAARSVSSLANTADNAAIGVPMLWTDALMFSADESPAKREVYTRFVLAQPILTAAMTDRIVKMVRETCLGHAFDTRGSTDPKSGWVVNESTKWDMRPAFGDKMAAVSAMAPDVTTSESYRSDLRTEARTLGEGLMFKRAKGPRHPRTVHYNGHHFAFIIYKNNREGMWFDISLTHCDLCCTGGCVGK